MHLCGHDLMLETTYLDFPQNKNDCPMIKVILRRSISKDSVRLLRSFMTTNMERILVREKIESLVDTGIPENHGDVEDNLACQA